jgi:hypothetical protein
MSDESTGSLGIKAYVDPQQLARDVAIDPTDIDGAVLKHAGLFVHYAMQAALARQQADNIKTVAKALEAKLYKLHRDNLTADAKKTTEKQIESEVMMDERYMKIQRRLSEAEAQAALAEAAREAFRHRKDMLVQRSVDTRVERQGELRIMAAKEAEQAQQQAKQGMMQTIAARASAGAGT